jgi:hypothetical protein
MACRNRFERPLLKNSFHYTTSNKHSNSALDEIMTTGLSMVSDGCGKEPNHQVEMRIAPLNGAIQKMQSVMSAYQIHEARELLCLDMTRQVEKLRELKSEMTSLLQIKNPS